MTIAAVSGDRRLTPANGRVAHESLRGKVDAAAYVAGAPARIAVPVADLLAAPDGARDRQLLFGAGVLVLERRDGHAFLRAEADGYCGYVAEAALGAPLAPTHLVASPGTHVYRDASIKSGELTALSLGSLLRVTEAEGSLWRLEGGGHVPAVHLRPVADVAQDPVAVAASLLGTPYLWGGNSRAGIDCSGLVQLSFRACGIACPGDSDMQAGALGTPLAAGAEMRRGDLLFWKGHVGIVEDDATLLHANAWAMAVAREPLDAALARIGAEGPLLSHRRL